MEPTYNLNYLVLSFYSSHFAPQRCWLRSATRVTYLCMLPEISSLAA